MLQQAIWWLEGETTGTTDANYADNPYAAAAVAQFASIAGAKHDAPAGYLGVYALNNFASAAARNLYINNGTVSEATQDMLYYSVADGGATLMLLGGALVGLGALRRRYGI